MSRLRHHIIPHGCPCGLTGDIETPLWVKAPFLALCWVLDVVYDNRPIQKVRLGHALRVPRGQSVGNVVGQEDR